MEIWTTQTLGYKSFIEARIYGLDGSKISNLAIVQNPLQELEEGPRSGPKILISV